MSTSKRNDPGGIKRIALARLLPRTRDIREVGRARVDAAAALLEREGFAAPVILDKKSRAILSGHARILAARQLWSQGKKIPGLRQGVLPAIETAGLSEAEKQALLAAEDDGSLASLTTANRLQNEFLGHPDVSYELPEGGLEYDENDALIFEPEGYEPFVAHDVAEESEGSLPALIDPQDRRARQLARAVMSDREVVTFSCPHCGETIAARREDLLPGKGG